MSEHVREIMTHDPVILEASTNVCEAARVMRDRNIGDVLVRKDGSLCGIVTDRDLVTGCIADERDPAVETLEQLCSTEVASLRPDSTVDEAVALMSERAVRRLPVMESGTPIGIVSLGDLARDRDPKSALGQISTAPAQA